MVVAQLSPSRRAVGWQKVLRQWLQWNETYERLTAEMYQTKEDPARLEDLIDQLDRVRQEVVAATRQLLANDGR